MTVVPLPIRQANARETTTGWSGLHKLTGFALAAAAVSIAGHFYAGLNDPLFLDEVWTGAFASEHTLSAVTAQIRNDSNAPIYYYLMFFWAKAFGVSNLSLRLPSLLFSLITPAAAWMALRTRWPSIALVWAATLALWTPGLEFSGDARCYALLMLAAVLNGAAFLRALEAPTLGRSAVWVASACLAVLIHYDAAYLAVAEAAIMLALHWRRVPVFWPSALVAAPALGWIAYHAPRLADFARPGAAWYDRLTIAQLPASLGFLVGASVMFPVLAVVLIVGRLLAGRDAAGSTDQTEEAPGDLWMVGMAALAAAGACLAVAVAKPTFTLRYLTPCAPGALLLVACAVQWASRRRWEPKALLIAAFAGLAALWMSQAPIRPRVYSFEAASAWLRVARPSTLAFFWDHPNTTIEAPDQLALVGGFFFRRAGQPVSVVPLKPSPSVDVSKLSAAAAGPDGAVLWLYDTRVHDTRARAAPPRIVEVDPGFVCRDFGSAPIGILACRRKSSS